MADTSFDLSTIVNNGYDLHSNYPPYLEKFSDLSLMAEKLQIANHDWRIYRN